MGPSLNIWQPLRIEDSHGGLDNREETRGRE